MPVSRRFTLASLVLVAAFALGGCSTTVTMTPAAGANDPLCAEVSVRLPGAVAGKDRVWTNAQATGAWGSPVVVALTCGLAAPAPTAELQCVTLGGVDWLVDAADSPNLRMTSYGREPAVEVYVNTNPETGGVSSNEALEALAPMVRQIPKISECISPDVLPEDAADSAP